MLCLHEVVKIFMFQFDESVPRFYGSKSFIDYDEIFIGCSQDLIKLFWWEREKNVLQKIFQHKEKTEKWPFLDSST